MNIALITDLHIGRVGENTYGVDVRQNFLDVLKAIKAEQPDLLIVDGDLCFDRGDISIYQWIKHQLDHLAIPYDLTVGNHDDGKMMAEIFGLQDSFRYDYLYFTRSLEDWKGIFLDTRIRSVSKEQLRWLELELKATQQPIIIFMHHPPIISDIPFMDDNHGLTNMTAFQDLLVQDKRTIPVFSGHYHAEKTICKNNIVLQITPSCFFQIAQHTSIFEVDHYKIAYRRIQLSKDTWKSTVRYLEGNKLEGFENG